MCLYVFLAEARFVMAMAALLEAPSLFLCDCPQQEVMSPVCSSPPPDTGNGQERSIALSLCLSVCLAIKLSPIIYRFVIEVSDTPQYLSPSTVHSGSQQMFELV